MICPNCQTEAQDDKPFCSHCGAILTAPQPIVWPPPADASPYDAPPVKPKGKWGWLIATGAFLLGCLISIGFAFIAGVIASNSKYVIWWCLAGGTLSVAGVWLFAKLLKLNGHFRLGMGIAFYTVSVLGAVVAVCAVVLATAFTICSKL